MILFQNDWHRYPMARVDYSTTNTSFLRYTALLKEMGVKNCLWPLAIMQPELIGVDPHSEVLSDAYKMKIGLECRYNIWYYLREVVRIPPVAGPNPIPYKANRGNMATTWTFINNMDIALIQPRQTGKSVSTDCLMIWLLFLGTSNSRINMITKDDALRKANVERLKKIRDLLPGYLVARGRSDSDNQFEVTCKKWENTYSTGVAQNSESSANNLGRGQTSPISHIDEGPFINFIGITLPAALAAGNAAREEARQHDRPHGNIFTTTAGKKDDRDGRYMYDMIHGGAKWTELFFDCVDKAAFHEMVAKNNPGRKILINATFSHRQLGYTDEWLYKTMAEANSYGDGANRDFFNVWTSGTQSSPLTPQLNEMIKNSVKEVMYNFVSKELYVVRWYVDEVTLQRMLGSEQFILGLDTSEAVGRDGIAGTIINTRDLSVVGAFNVNETNLIRFSNFLAEFLVRYKNVTLIPEKKSTGQMIVDALILKLPAMGEDPFKRIFNRIVENSNEKADLYKAICKPMGTRSEQFYDETKGYFGFNTTAETRALLYGPVLQNSAKKAGHLVHDKQLSEEIRGLVVKKGRIDHSASGHDDTVIAWLMANWLLTMGRNLDHYGIDTTKMLSEVTDNSRKLTPEEAYQRGLFNKMRKEVEEVYEQLVNAKETFVVMRLESKLEHLTRKLSALTSIDEDTVTSLTGLIQKASEERNIRNIKAARAHNVSMINNSMNPWGKIMGRGCISGRRAA